MWSADIGSGTELAQQRGHFYRGLCCVRSMIAGLDAGAFPGLFNVFSGEHAKDYGYSALLAGTRNSGSSVGGYRRGLVGDEDMAGQYQPDTRPTI